MPEYIYLATNPRMAGLVKIGKTTSLPSRRMKELYTTGVPEPFELECAFIVDNCTAREKAAHSALARSRIKGREFFEVSVEVALRRILPVLGDYSIYFAKSEYGIRDLAKKLDERETARRVREEQKREQRREQALAEQERRRRSLAIEQTLNLAQGDVHKWYRQEYARLFPRRSVWFYGLPVGFVSLFVLIQLKPNLAEGAMFLWAGLFAWVGGLVLQGGVENLRAKSARRVELDEELDARLKSVREITCSCSHCGQSLRLSRADVLMNDGRLEWFCPKCGTTLSFK